MKIRILQPVVIGGFPGAVPGDVIEMTESQAAEILGSRYGEVFKSGPVEAVETRTPEVETREPAPAKKRTKSALP